MKHYRSAFFVFILFFFVLNCAAIAGIRVNTEIIQLKTADGVTLTGAIRKPQPAKNNACVIMIHGYSGNFYSGIMGFLPQNLAENGLCTMTVNMRDHDRTPKKNRFRKNRFDIAAAVDEMAGRGYGPVFLFGHSMGTNRILYYLAATHDSRIAGTILSAPPGNLFEWNVRMFGRKTATHLLNQAMELSAGGKGNQWMLVDLGPLGKALYTADHLISLRGPGSVSDPYKNISRITGPVLIVHGLSDRLADPTISDRLKKNAGPGAAVTLIKIPGAGHRYRGHHKKLAETVSHWLINESGD